MNSLRVSVVIPAYNQAEFLAAAVQSVLDQTYQDFELIVVNDASPDDTSQIMAKFRDVRIKYLVHEANRGLPAARNTGMRASSGELVALLDADDYFHPEKLRLHVDFLAKHPQIGVSYNSRYELNHSSTSIRELWRPPGSVSLADLVLGWPFSPSDMVVRAEWAVKVGLFDERYVHGGEDLDFPCRLSLAGCQFARVDRALNYRRYHSGRKKKSLECRLQEYVRALQAVSSDPRCPAEVLALISRAYSARYLEVAYWALAQSQASLGQHCIREAVKWNPAILEGKPCALVRLLMQNAIADGTMDHGPLLCDVFAQLPTEVKHLQAECDWAVARGHLLKGIRDVMWGRMAEGKEHFGRAADLSAQMDEHLVSAVCAQLLDRKAECGTSATEDVLRRLVAYLGKVGPRRYGRWLRGCYLINQAFDDYRQGRHSEVLPVALRAISCEPTYLTNRGVLAVLTRSMWRSLRRRSRALQGGR